MRALDLEYNLLDFHYEQFFDLRSQSINDQKVLNLQEFTQHIVLSGVITEEMINNLINFFNNKEYIEECNNICCYLDNTIKELKDRLLTIDVEKNA